MKIKVLRNRGFSLIELLVVVLIMSIIAGFAVAGFQNYVRYQQYNQAVSDVSYVLRDTRLAARSAQDDESHGLYFTTNSITQFAGDTYVSGAVENIVISYNLVDIQWSFVGGVDEIVFKKLTGIPSATGTIEVSGKNFSDSTTFTLSETGVIQ